MAKSDWSLQGEWMKNCTCAYGCPCDFNAPPTKGYCKGLFGMHVVKGHFDQVKLDGLNFATVLEFPGPLHQGNGAIQPIVDERASPAQREALFAILSGKHSAEGTLFHIASLIVTKMHEPLFAPFQWQLDLAGRRARLNVLGILETDVEPIKNPVTGADHRIQVHMPEGFEHRRGEVASARIASMGAIKLQVEQGHSTLATVTQTPAGVAA
ncbi:MAG: DUF1326 domain-containing protein [Alphaproteobacteria bacterium]|nr:DUF1326 domain-containing protein [Alphaproteobacteria bacterium]